MVSVQKVAVVMVLVLSSVLLGCQPTGPDALPVRPEGAVAAPHGFCNLEPVTATGDPGAPVIGNKLIVLVRNDSARDLPPSSTRIRFSWSESGEQDVDIPTPLIGPGRTVPLRSVEFPSLCFDPDCDFEITVDANEEIDEANEANNNVTGMCLG